MVFDNHRSNFNQTMFSALPSHSLFTNKKKHKKVPDHAQISVFVQHYQYGTESSEIFSGRQPRQDVVSDVSGSNSVPNFRMLLVAW